MLPTKFWFIWPSGFKREDFLKAENSFRGEESKKSANQKQETLVVAMFVNRSGRNEYSL